MKYYFLLQEKMIRRQLVALGLKPIPTYLFSIVIFIFLSIYVYQKSKYAIYLYALIPLSMAANLSNGERNLFIKSIYSNSQFLKIRMIENAIISFPFVTCLLLKNQWLVALAIILINIFQSFFNLKSSNSFSIPTPFFKHPFEFTAGFRKSFLWIVLCYLFTIIAIMVNNFNLGLFSIALIAISCTFFYATPEPQFYVWIFSCNANKFIIRKAKTGVIYGALLMLPVSLLLALFNFNHVYIITGVYILGVLLILISTLAKYASYPAEINLSKIIIIAMSAGLSFYFPPLLLLLIPLFYKQSKKQLKPILG